MTAEPDHTIGDMRQTALAIIEPAARGPIRADIGVRTFDEEELVHLVAAALTAERTKAEERVYEAEQFANLTMTDREGQYKHRAEMAEAALTHSEEERQRLREALALADVNLDPNTSVEDYDTIKSALAPVDQTETGRGE